MKLRAIPFIALILFNSIIRSEPDLNQIATICAVGATLSAAMCTTIWHGTGILYENKSKNETKKAISSIENELSSLNTKLATIVPSDNNYDELSELKIQRDEKKVELKRLIDDLASNQTETNERKIAFYNLWNMLTSISLSTQTPQKFE